MILDNKNFRVIFTLIEFINHANSIHDTIKFEYEISNEKINFLDTTIYFNDKHELESIIFIKPR